MPDTYIEPFVAYRAWNWTTEGITSLNGALWTPKVAFEATCHYARRLALDASRRCFRKRPGNFGNQAAHIMFPTPICTCGMYAGINMQHMIDIGYIRRGIHGEVHLWGRLYRHTLGWRAQFAYPKFFVVPANMIPFRLDEAKQRLDSLTEFGVDIWLQPERRGTGRAGKHPAVGKRLRIQPAGLVVAGREAQEMVRRATRAGTCSRSATAWRCSAATDGGGIGIVTEIDGDEMRYTMFSPNVVYRKPVKDVIWNERNWRWETSGLGSMRKLEPAICEAVVLAEENVMKLVAIDIIGTIKELVKSAVKEVLLLLAIILFGLSAPLLFTVGIEALALSGADMRIWARALLPHSGRSLARFGWSSSATGTALRQWQRAGKLSTWRQDHGGIVYTVGKSIWFMVSGFFGSVAAEVIFAIGLGT